MGLNVRSALCIFAAVLGLMTLDPAAADDKGGKIPIKKCDKWERPKFVHGKIICVPCGGHRFKKTYVCKHPHTPCKPGFKPVGKWCVRVRCGKFLQKCCVSGKFKYCRRGLKCSRKLHRCVRPRPLCGRHGQKCCRWRRCKGGLKCVGHRHGVCKKVKPCGFPFRRCCKGIFGKRCRGKGYICWKGRCRPKFLKKKGGKGAGKGDNGAVSQDSDDGDDSDDED